MPLKFIADSIDDIPEPLREHYQEREGKYVLAVDDALPKAEVAKLQRAIEHEKRQRSTAITEKTALEQRLAELEAQIKAQPTDKVEPTKEAERLKSEYDQRLKAIEAKLQEAEQKSREAQQQLEANRIASILRQAAVEHGVPAEAVEELIELPSFRSPWKLTADGQPAPFDGESPRLDPDKPTQTMSPKAYVQEYLKEHKHWVPTPTGGGATGASARTTGGVLRATRDQMRDHKTYLRLREQAEKTGAQIEVTE